MAEYVTRKAHGPRTSAVSADEAREKLLALPNFPKDAKDVVIQEEKGRWVATFKVAEFPPPKSDSEEAPEPSGPPTEAPESEPSDDEPKSEDKPKDDKPGEDKPGGDKKPNVEQTLSELSSLVHAIAEHLGIGPTGEDSPVPGLDEGLDGPPSPDGGPPAGPPGLGGPPKPPGGAQHSLKIKPGESIVQPGQTPPNSPAFASVQERPETPPFPEIGRVATFKAIDDDRGQTIASVMDELNPLVKPWGYEVQKVRRQGGEIHALISAR